MAKHTLFLLTGILAGALFMTGCVSGKDDGPAVAASTPALATKDCNSLLEARRAAVRRIDDIERRGAGVSAKQGLFVLGALLGGLAGAPQLLDAAKEEKDRALLDLRSGITRLDLEIEQKQCTLDARTRAGKSKAVEDARYDGTYAGNGSTDTGCTEPLAELKIAAGRVSGSLTDRSSLYDIKGRAFEDGTVLLMFKRTGGVATDDFEGKLDGGAVSFAAAFDVGRLRCTYRFSLTRG